MKEYQSLGHTRWDCKYHIVIIPKRRKDRSTWWSALLSPPGTVRLADRLASASLAARSVAPLNRQTSIGAG